MCISFPIPRYDICSSLSSFLTLLSELLFFFRWVFHIKTCFLAHFNFGGHHWLSLDMSVLFFFWPLQWEEEQYNTHMRVSNSAFGYIMSWGVEHELQTRFQSLKTKRRYYFFSTCSCLLIYRPVSSSCNRIQLHRTRTLVYPHDYMGWMLFPLYFSLAW